MITNDDWNEALDAWTAEERERLGGPPSREDVAAYLRGELAPADAARVRALLVYYPELTPLLTERITKPRASWNLLLLRGYAVAATLAILVLTSVVMQQRELGGPSAFSAQYELNAHLMRGPERVHELEGGQERYLLTVVPSAPPEAARYAIELTRGSRVLWRTENVRPIDDAFVVQIPGEFLAPGTYALSLRANGGLVDRYPFRVTE